VERTIVDGLDPNETYYFAVSAVDLAGNASELSVFEGFLTPDIIPEIDALEFDQGGLITDNSAADELLISGANFMGTIGANWFVLRARPHRSTCPAGRAPLVKYRWIFPWEPPQVLTGSGSSTSTGFP
jgi:hypothetical protein